MCVNESRSALLSRSAFMGAVGAAALPLLAHGAPLREAAPLAVPAGLSAPNARAAALAAASPRVRALFGDLHRLAASIGDAALRADVLDVLETRTPKYYERYPSDASRAALCKALADGGFIAARAPQSGVFPLPDGQRALPFWAAPGSETSGHHSYPGGLCAHELFNASMAEQFAQTYDRIYFNGRASVDRDTVIAAALYHDIMKTVVFAYEANATFLPELSIAGTGAHHILSGAEAIVRGRDAQFVVTLLSAHAAPSLGDEAKVVRWCQAAALIAGVDPQAYGMLRGSGSSATLASPPRIESFVNHLSDHDFVLSIPASKDVEMALVQSAPQFAVAPGGAEFRWWRLGVLSRTSSIALYHELTRGGDAFTSALRQAV